MSAQLENQTDHALHKNELLLWCVTAPKLQLVRSSFRNVLDNTVSNCRRGNVSPADGIEGCFRWSTAVRALLLLLFQQRAAELANNAAPATIQGQSGSLAASLDYALSKQPLWIIDFFGLKENGDALARQIISRVNAERKRPGPVILRLSPWAIQRIRIRIFVDEKELHTENETVALANQLQDRLVTNETVASGVSNATAKLTENKNASSLFKSQDNFEIACALSDLKHAEPPKPFCDPVHLRELSEL